MKKLLRSSKGSVLVETAGATLLFASFVIFATMASISVFDTSRDGRMAGIAGDLMHQAYIEAGSANIFNMSRITNALIEEGYIGENEDYQMFVAVIGNDSTNGHTILHQNRTGVNNQPGSRLTVEGAGSGNEGIHLGTGTYQIEEDQIMIVVEILTGKRGRVNVENSLLPYYEFAVIVHQT